MTTVRCHACRSAMPVEAPWCTLCFAERPGAAKPEPEPEPVMAVAAVPAQSASFDISPADPLGLGVAPHALSAPAVSAPVSGAPTWPCAGCEARVPLDEPACPSCGTPFMGGVNPDVSLRVPVVGDLASMSQGGRVWFMAGGTVALALLLVVVYLLLGHIV